MEFLTLIIFIIVLVIALRNNPSSSLERIQKKLEHIEDQMKGIRKLLAERPDVSKKPEIKVDPPTSQVSTEPAPAFPQPPPTEKQVEKVKEPVAIENIIKPLEEKVSKAGDLVKADFKKRIIAPSPSPGFFDRNPDLEKFIGENLANKIGIGILVIGIGFFVKYAIDQNWINEIGRIMVGILCGGILLGLAHYLKEKFHAFSSVLVGGGIAVSYITITIGFQEYQIFSQGAAFAIMVAITGFTVVLSIGYNRMELAIMAILGGFGSPFMVSTGEGNYIVLFTYILVLNVGMLSLAYYKKWSPVNIISYIFTLFLFGSWLGAKFDGMNSGMVSGALFFSTAFYLIFFVMNLINNLKEKTQFKALEFSMLMSNTFLYYAAGMFILSFEFGSAFRGLFTLLLAVFNFIFVLTLYKSERADRNLVFLLIGLVLTFVSLAAPVQLEGNNITLFWAAEAVLLLWLSQKSGIKLMKYGSAIINGLMIISLLMDWGALYNQSPDQPYTIVLNRAYTTGLFSLTSLLVSIILLRKELDIPEQILSTYKYVLSVVAVLVCYIFNLLELHYQLDSYDVSLTAHAIVIGTYNMLFILTLMLLEPRLSMPEVVRPYFAGWGPFAVLSYLMVTHSFVLRARDALITHSESNTGFFVHYLLVGLLIVISALSINAFRKLKEFNRSSHNIYSWFFIAFFVFMASSELDHLVVFGFFQEGASLGYILEQNHKIGWPILWGLGAFAIIFVGLRRKILHLRIISLVLFLITLLKLFLLDIQGISEGGKIAAFISLGVLLLIISFMYQRLKRILLVDDNTNNSLKKSS